MRTKLARVKKLRARGTNKLTGGRDIGPAHKMGDCRSAPEQNAQAVAKYILNEICLKPCMPFRVSTKKTHCLYTVYVVCAIRRQMYVHRVTASNFCPECNGSCERYNPTLAHMCRSASTICRKLATKFLSS